MPGQGSCFEIRVPLARSLARTTAQPEAPAQRPASSLDAQYVLCIDNEPDILDGMAGLLQKWGAQALTAATEEEAVTRIERLRREHHTLPAILLVDYHLDDNVTGIEVIDTLRRVGDARLPAIILTADHSDEVTDAIRRAGYAILHKPVKPAALRALMTRVLSRRSVA